MLCFSFSILLSLGLALLCDHRLFASQHTVHVATEVACEEACRATHCDAESLTFRVDVAAASAAFHETFRKKSRKKLE